MLQGVQQPWDEVFLTVRAHFNDSAKQALLDDRYGGIDRITVHA
jgi:hypothetical protein